MTASVVRELGLVPEDPEIWKLHCRVDEVQIGRVPHVRVSQIAGDTMLSHLVKVISRTQLGRQTGKGPVDEAAAARPVGRQQFWSGREEHCRRRCQLVRRDVLAVAAKAPDSIKDGRAEELLLSGRIERPVPVRQPSLEPARLDCLLKVG